MSLNHERVQPILRVDGLNVELKIRNKQKKLVENVSFEVEPGRVISVTFAVLFFNNSEMSPVLST